MWKEHVFDKDCGFLKYDAEARRKEMEDKDYPDMPDHNHYSSNSRASDYRNFSNFLYMSRMAAMSPESVRMSPESVLYVMKYEGDSLDCSEGVCKFCKAAKQGKCEDMNLFGLVSFLKHVCGVSMFCGEFLQWKFWSHHEQSYLPFPEVQKALNGLL